MQVNLGDIIWVIEPEGVTRYGVFVGNLTANHIYNPTKWNMDCVVERDDNDGKIVATPFSDFQAAGVLQVSPCPLPDHREEWARFVAAWIESNEPFTDRSSQGFVIEALRRALTYSKRWLPE